MKIPLALLALFFIYLPVSAQWIRLDHCPNSESYAMEIYNNSLYIGGAFQQQLHMPGPSGSTLLHAGRWNGTQFDSLGTGLNQGGYVRDMAVYNKELILCGGFTSGDGVPVNSIASWNGSAFDSLGSGITGINVVALAVYNGDLYAGGNFTTAGGIPAMDIARWNGSAWDSVGSGISNQVWDLAVYNGELYACGIITDAGGQPCNNLAKWNGSSWSSVPGGTDGLITCMQVYAGELYVGGLFTMADTFYSPRIARWNGSSWNTVKDGLTQGGTVFHLGQYNNQLILGGFFTEVDHLTALNIAKWNGSSWGTLGTGTEIFQSGADVNVTHVYQGDLFVAGTFTSLYTVNDTAYYIAIYHELPSALEETQDSLSFSFFPNPADEQLAVHSLTGGRLSICDLSGREVKSVDLKGGRETISAAELTPGIYLLKLGTETRKLVIRH